MTSIAIVSAKHSPGATVATMALAYAWSIDQPALVVELDQDGGDIVPMFGLTNDGPGLLSLAAAGRHADSVPSALDHSQRFGARQMPVVTAPQSPAQVYSSTHMLEDRLASTLDRSDHAVFIDAGRFRDVASASSMLRNVDLILMTMRPTLATSQAVAARLAALNDLGPEVGMLLVGERPYSATEIQTTLDIPVVGVLADDAKGVAAFTTAPDSRLSTASVLLRSARTIVAHLQSRRFLGAEVGK